MHDANIFRSNKHAVTNQAW